MAKKLEIRCEVEEGDLYPVAARALETNKLVDDVLGAADDLDIAAEGAVRLAMSLQATASPVRWCETKPWIAP